MTIKLPKIITGEIALALRKKLNLNQQQFWSRVHVTQSAGSRYEGGRTIDMRTQTLLRIAYDTDPAKVVASLRNE